MNHSHWVFETYLYLPTYFFLSIWLAKWQGGKEPKDSGWENPQE